VINKDIPNKLAEIIRDTWPNLFNPPKNYYAPSEKKTSRERKKTQEGKVQSLCE